MFRDMGHRDETALESMMERFLSWIERKLELCEYLGCLALIEGEFVVAGAGLWLMDWPAHMIGSSAKRGNILNVDTEPAFRHRGLEPWLIEAALHWCKANDIDFAILHASQEGRRLYESLSGQETRCELSFEEGSRPDPLLMEPLTWIAEVPRTYKETMDVWRTTCPRFSAWKDTGWVA